MQKISWFFLFLVFVLPFSGFCCDHAVDIKYPAITNWDDWNIDFLLDKGENELVKGEFFNAQEYFTKAIVLCKEHQNQEMRLFRALFARSLAFAGLDYESEAINDIHSLEKIIESFQCDNVQELNAEYTANGKPILGPDEISIKECLERVKNTVDQAKEIIIIAPIKRKVQAAVVVALNLAAEKASKCCRSGGVWKACVKPLLEKWLILKEWDRECRRINRWLYLPSLD